MMSEYYVYVYTDPMSGVVRYVGSGLKGRKREHTKPSQIDLPKNESPFYRWLRTHRGIEWHPHRKWVLGPVSKEEAIAYEQQLIEENFETVLNVRAAGNGKAMRPIRGGPREPYGPRSASGREKARRNFRKNNFGGDVRAGRGIYRDVRGWRVRVRVDGKMVSKSHTTYCEALRYRKSLESH